MTKKEFFLQAYLAALAGNPINRGMMSCGVSGYGGGFNNTESHVRLCSSIAAAATKEVEERGLFEVSEDQP